MCLGAVFELSDDSIEIFIVTGQCEFLVVDKSWGMPGMHWFLVKIDNFTYTDKAKIAYQYTSYFWSSSKHSGQYLDIFEGKRMNAEINFSWILSTLNTNNT